jgi:hypothetical protein
MAGPSVMMSATMRSIRSVALFLVVLRLPAESWVLNDCGKEIRSPRAPDRQGCLLRGGDAEGTTPHAQSGQSLGVDR